MPQTIHPNNAVGNEEMMSRETEDSGYLLRGVAFGLLALCLIRLHRIAESFYYRHPKQIKYCLLSAAILCFFSFCAYLYNILLDWKERRQIESDSSKILVGTSIKSKKPVYIDEKARLYHTCESKSSEMRPLSSSSEAFRKTCD